MNFERIAPYLQDPLVLIGFSLLLGFLLIRAIVRANIIPQLSQAAGYRVLQRVLLYGFVIAIALILLGFGLKYRELSRREQAAAVSLLRQELAGNFQVLSELQANAKTLRNATTTVSGVLRTPGIRLLAMLFPADNLDPTKAVPASADLAQQALGDAAKAGLLEDPLERDKFGRAATAIVGTIQRTLPTVRSLADGTGHRYIVSEDVWNSQLPILRKVDLVDVAAFLGVYQEARLARTNYDVVTGRCIDYLEATKAFFSPADGKITRHSLAAVLAAERLFITLVTEYESKLIAHLANLEELQRRVLDGATVAALGTSG